MAFLHNSSQNRLLAALPADELARLSPHLEQVAMPLGDIPDKCGNGPLHVYFPATSIVSLHYVMGNGVSAEIAGIGNEGMLGIPLFMGTSTAPSRIFVRSKGYGYRMDAQVLADEFKRAGAMQRLLRRYTEALVTQASQTATCNRRHSVKQQLCRWLLVTLDRSPSNELVLTQKLVAGMLGVSCRAVAEAAANLKQAGIIRNRRGTVAVLDRSRLEDHACECYGVVKAEFDRLFGPDPDWRHMAGSAIALPVMNAGICVTP